MICIGCKCIMSWEESAESEELGWGHYCLYCIEFEEKKRAEERDRRYRPWAYEDED